jgi:hypothetical protein
MIESVSLEFRWISQKNPEGYAVIHNIELRLDGSVMRKTDRVRPDGGINYGNAELYSSWAYLSVAYPHVAADIAKWLRDSGFEWPMSFQTDMKIKRARTECSICHQKKFESDFPQNLLSPRGVHQDCCECRIAYCKKNRAKCEATPEYDRCTTCEVRTETKVITDTTREVSPNGDTFTSCGENITEVIARMRRKLGRVPTEGEVISEMAWQRVVRKDIDAEQGR